MKRTILFILAVLILVICIWIIGTGFSKETSAFVDDYAVNSDNSIMTIHTGVGSSVGFIRKAVAHQNTDGEIKIDFISAFGGINGSIGAKSTYEIPLDENSKTISIYQGSAYKVILTKDVDSGEWISVK